MLEFLLIFLAWFIGGFVNNLSGMGAAIIALPIMALILPVEVVIPVSCICGASIGVYLTIIYYKYAHYKMIAPLVLGSIPGTFVGLSILLWIDKGLLQIIIGLLLIFYAYWQYSIKIAKIHKESIVGASFIGFLAGLSNASTSFGGPPGYAYSVYVGWDRKAAIGTLSLYYLFMSAVTILSQYIAGLYTENTLYYALLSLIGMFSGIFSSIPFVQRITVENYRKFIIIVIFVAGLLCMVEGF